MKPTSEAWFNHWKIHLENNGVKLNFGMMLDSIKIINNKVVSAVVIDSIESRIIVEADYYVFSLPVEVLSIIVENSRITRI